MPQRKGPTDAQLEAAIEGARHMPEAPRGAFSGGRITGRSGADDIEPDELIKRETAVFEPGTHGKKPQANSDRREPTPERDQTMPRERDTAGRTPGSAEGERDPSEQSR